MIHPPEVRSTEKAALEPRSRNTSPESPSFTRDARLVRRATGGEFAPSLPTFRVPLSNSVHPDPYGNVRYGIAAVPNTPVRFGRLFTEQVPPVYFGTYPTEQYPWIFL